MAKKTLPMKRPPRFRSVLLVAMLPLLMASPCRAEEIVGDEKLKAICARSQKSLLTRKFDEAEAGYRQALAEADKRKLVDKRLSECLHGLAGALVLREKYEEAKPIVERMEVIDEKLYGKDAWELEQSLTFRAGIATNLDDMKSLENITHRMIDLYEKNHHENDRKLVQYLLLQAMFHQKAKSPAKAESLLKRAIALEEGNPAGTKNLILIMEAYADLLEDAKRVPEAKTLRIRIDRIDQSKAKE